ncbi:MAG: hypothetical protein U0904_00195 [Candidatus Nanopelagicales bacterium]|nr:hypothetical protein [Candidatus Nanopelagicales bacterium]
MRTTVDVDEEVLAAARTLAAEKKVSLGAALSELARRGLAPRSPIRRRGIPTFEVGEHAAVITPEMVRAANEES